MTRQAPSSSNGTSSILPIATAAIAIAIFIADIITNLEIAVAVLYVAVVLMAARFCQARGVLLVAAGCVALTLLDLFLTPPSGPEATGVINTFLSILAIGLTAFLVLQNQSAEAELREQADLLDLTHDAVFSRDMDGAITDWNRGAEELYGFKRAEALGKLPYQLLETTFPAPLNEINAELLRTGRWEGELVHRKRDGTRLVLGSRWSLRRDKQGRPAAILETNNDITERKRAERELRRSETYLAEAQRLSHTGSFGWNVSSGKIHWSEETFRIFEYDRANVPTVELILKRTHPDDRALVQQTIVRAQRENEDFDIEHRILMSDGSVKYLKVAGHASMDETGALEFAGSVMDITPIKRAEEAQRRSEAYLAEAQRLSRTGSWAWNVATRELLHWSQELYRMYGLDPNRGKPSWEEARRYIHPEDRARYLDNIDRAIRERADCEVDYRSVLLDGSIRYIHAAAHPVFNASGDLVEFLETEMDITDRKRAEYLIGQVFEMSPDRVSIVGRDYRYQRVNPVYERNWKMPAEKFVGMHLADFVGMEAFEQTIKPYMDRCFAGEEVSYTEWFPTAAYGQRYLGLSYSPLRPDSERVEAALVIIRDLTEHMLDSEALRQAQAELARVARLTTMGELVASIAHEVAQPLTGIVTNSNACLRWLNLDKPDLDEARDALSRIARDGARAGEVIRSLRALAKKSGPELAKLDMNDAIQEVLALTRSELQRRGIRLHTKLSADNRPVLGDRVQLQQVLLNLIMNGVEAMSAVTDRPKMLAITSESVEPGGVLVAVEDTGAGLDPATADRIFDSFYTTKPEGMGMGLAISRSIVGAHGGRIWANPNKPHGAVFRFTLPIEEKSSTGPSEEAMTRFGEQARSGR